MTVIAESAALAEFCARLAGADFITVDTEFMRERTYWPQLCLIQVAGPDVASTIDPLAPGMDLKPLLDLLYDPRLLKVFHAARQDLEIFFHMTGAVPHPLFDTQVAAMVCGYGEAASYETLASQLAKARIDKSARFTDWSMRPLSDRQVEYALADVTHLRQVYAALARRLTATGRAGWLGEEMATLMDPATYRLDPETSWMRFKPKNPKPRYLAVLKEVAAWREREAQKRDIPRNRIIRDESVVEIAAHPPRTLDDMARLRGMSKGFAEGRLGQDLLNAIERGIALPDAQVPRLDPTPELPGGLGATVDLLKVLLKMKCEAAGVAQKLVATTADLELVAADDDAEVPALRGWRRELFGRAAIDLKHGRLALGLDGRRPKIMDVAQGNPAP
ncbi:MAG: ribonuclease D [Alphaproteobacteria bacterium]|nr:ribonuclease D [Alphaproteobacteria bacterium]